MDVELLASMYKVCRRGVCSFQHATCGGGLTDGTPCPPLSVPPPVQSGVEELEQMQVKVDEAHKVG